MDGFYGVDSAVVWSRNEGVPGILGPCQITFIQNKWINLSAENPEGFWVEGGRLGLSALQNEHWGRGQLSLRFTWRKGWRRGKSLGNSSFRKRFLAFRAVYSRIFGAVCCQSQWQCIFVLLTYTCCLGNCKVQLCFSMADGSQWPLPPSVLRNWSLSGLVEIFSKWSSPCMYNYKDIVVLFWVCFVLFCFSRCKYFNFRP